MSLYGPSVVQTKKLLTNLRAWLDHAKAHAAQRQYEADVLLTGRPEPRR